jgi:hypothetical protein
MALLIWAAVAPGFMVAQIVVRFGIPSVTPGLAQAAARDGLMIPDHAWAPAASGLTMIKNPKRQAIPIRGVRVTAASKRRPLT